jgi:hypothetical protein
LEVVAKVTLGSAFFTASTVFLTVVAAITLLVALGIALLFTDVFATSFDALFAAGVTFLIGCTGNLVLCLTLKFVTALLTAGCALVTAVAAADLLAVFVATALLATVFIALFSGLATGRVAVLEAASVTVFVKEDLEFRLAAFFSVALDFAEILLALESTWGFAGFFML